MRHSFNRLQQRATKPGQCRWRFAWMWMAALMGFVFGALAGQEENVVLEIKADGTCLIRREQIQFRRNFEQMVQSYLQQEKNSENDANDKESSEDSDKPEQPEMPDKPQAPKKLSDDELISTVKKMYSSDSEFFGVTSDGNIGLESISLEKETVRMAFTNSFPSLQEMLTGHYWYIPQVYSASLKIEKHGTNQFRMTYNPYPDERFWDRLADRFKREGTKVDYKVILPGKIISSGFSNVNDRTTWITIDSKNKASLTNDLQRLRKPVEIVAELGGLTLDEPLDSLTLAMKQPGSTTLESPQGASAESTNYTILLQQIIITTVYNFPGTNAPSPASPSPYGMRYGQQAQGMMFAAEIQPPPGRKLLSIGNIQVAKATDNRGQALKLKAEKSKPSAGSKQAAGNDTENTSPTEIAITPPGLGSETIPTIPDDDTSENSGEDSEPPGMAEMADVSSNGESSDSEGENSVVFTRNQDNVPIMVNWSMPVPSPEISAIEEMEVTAIAKTIADWKSLTLTNVQASATNAIDLSSLLPGSRMFITQFKAGKQNKNLEARLEGPPGIRDFEIKFITSENNNSMNMSERNFINKGNQSVRKINVQSYDYSSGREKTEEPPGVLVRFPEDSKREKVRFKLVGLDIY